MAKMDADKLKELFLNNFEKVIFGVLVLFFVTMVLAALKVKPYTKKPDQLNSACEQARSKIESVQEVEPVVRNYERVVSAVQEPIPATDYTTPIAWNPILSKEGQKRRAPKALAIQNLVVKEWHGSVQKPQKIDEETGQPVMAMDDGLGGRASTTEGVRCCILLGEIPYLDQEEEFQKKLGLVTNVAGAQMNGGMVGMGGMNSQDPDAPYYYNYIVERAEVPADGNMENLNWVNLHLKGSPNEKEIRRFNPQSGDAGYGMGGGGMDIPEKYRPPQLWRRPSSADKAEKEGTANDGKTGNKASKNPRVANPQMMPGMMGEGMSANGLLMARDTLMGNLPQVVQNENRGGNMFNWVLYLPYSDVFELDPSTLNGMYGEMGMGRNARKNAKNTKEDAKEAQANDEGEDEEDEDDDEDVIQPNGMGMENQMDQIANIRLFRYVDYTVEVGKQYVYRVRVSLHNPNYQYEPAFALENPEDAKPKYLESPYSNVTHPVAIPLDLHFYCSGLTKFYPVKPEDKKDPKIKKWSPYLTLLPVKFNAKTGNEDFTFFKQLAPDVKEPTKGKKKKALVKKEEPIRLLPGQLLDLMVFEDEIRDLSNADGMRSYNAQRRFDDEEEEDREQKMFKTSFVLLDVRGGEELYEPIQERDLTGADEQLKKNPTAIYSPVSVLLMGAGGELIIQSELEDLVEVYRRRDPMEMNSSEMMVMTGESELLQEQDKKASRKRRGKKGEGEIPPEPKRGKRSKLNDRL